MVFTNLGTNEKDAFFSLLDEYFASRPEIFGNSEAETNPGSSAAASAAHRALAANPEATSRFLASGLRSVGQAAPKSSPYAAAASNPDIANAIGRLGAASISHTAPPPTLPRRGTAESPPPPTTSSAANLKSVRKFGSDVDTTSAKNMFSSIRTAGKTPQAPPPITPPAFAPRKNAYGPPPSRAAAAAATPPAQEEEAEEEEAQGEWAEALYDYDSTDAGDLQIRANQNVWVTERTSNDWWTGEFQGKTGLFPASYVKIL
ncbi:SH3-domain-containing protein [Mycena belliarum]|uniref:SH3-domain-containing protein n=1 Tax=Mycena belliarum TaxID=1033014 RepID=A0AAD6U2A1_9AGAR|nr:SH3-domain-containing protein [Mycena belliae]